MSPLQLLELGVDPACYQLIYQGATIQGQKIVPVLPLRVRVDHTLKKTEVFRGASLHHQLYVCYALWRESKFFNP